MKIEGWGRIPSVDAEVCRAEDDNGLFACLPASGTTIAHGLGRSYGGSALNNHAILTERLDKLLNFNSELGWLTCESGVSLNDILEIFVPRGWIVPVLPGTKYITVGGALASDIHGKNHHVDGCFSNFVDTFELMLADGSRVECSRTRNADLFYATCGGMGLTGLITRVTFKLKPIVSSDMCQVSIKSDTLKEVFSLFNEYDAWPYTVAWLDGFRQKNQDWRSVFIAGYHAEEGNLAYQPHKAWKLPCKTPHGLINKYTIRLFNQLYFLSAEDSTHERKVLLDEFFFPLDRLQNWNRVFGHRGLVQYQVVLPPDVSFETIGEILNRLNQQGLYTTLAVLKKMGPANDNLLSFPMEGYTISLDFKWSSAVGELLDKLDELIVARGGRHYLTKDARLSAKTFRKGYSELDKFIEIRDKYNLSDTFQSLQSKRLGI